MFTSLSSRIHLNLAGSSTDSRFDVFFLNSKNKLEFGVCVLYMGAYDTQVNTVKALQIADSVIYVISDNCM